MERYPAKIFAKSKRYGNMLEDYGSFSISSFVSTFLFAQHSSKKIIITDACSYSTITLEASVDKGRRPDIDYCYRTSTTTRTVMDFFTALWDVDFDYLGHNAALEIQATVLFTADKPSKVAMWRGVIIAYIDVALYYFLSAFLGYYMFGDELRKNIFVSLEKRNQYGLLSAFVKLLVKGLDFKPSAALQFAIQNAYVGEYMIRTQKHSVGTYC
ncbi:lysine histidine transporter 2-like [Mercurialis annua]|uniref:lysine histidine transporter 2-like n=1 Tax=Mercurialis annua TaxID=3986 RepID=UPI002160C6A6|nr:lysine histidine transporter 2-like [Mercurialis annua]